MKWLVVAASVAAWLLVTSIPLTSRSCVLHRRVYLALILLTAVCFILDEPRAGCRLLIAQAVWVFVALFLPDDDEWKRLWGKLKSQVLTAVAGARFQQQVKESAS
jgi:hypothetical protein